MKTLDLLDYSRFLRRRYFEALSKLPWEDLVKDRGTSFPSLKDIFVHMVFVLDAYINYILQGNPDYPHISYSDYDSMDKIKNYMAQVEATASANLNKLTPEALSGYIDRKQKDGSTIQVPVEDLLLDFFQEETHHRGELLALMWQMDVTPPHMGFIPFTLSRKRK